MLNDLRFAFRQLLKNPGFTAVAVLTLAICIGANLAIFAVMDAILVRSLPLPQADRLVVIHNAYPASGVERGQATIADYFERRGSIDALEALSMFRESPCIVGERDAARWIQAAGGHSGILPNAGGYPGQGSDLHFITLLASLLPAIGAARISPAVAMRNE
jgi:hypothetical protein